MDGTGNKIVTRNKLRQRRCLPSALRGLNALKGFKDLSGLSGPSWLGWPFLPFLPFALVTLHWDLAFFTKNHTFVRSPLGEDIFC